MDLGPAGSVTADVVLVHITNNHDDSRVCYGAVSRCQNVIRDASSNTSLAVRSQGPF
jgi:hypothetical protein